LKNALNENTESIFLTIKNYKNINGLSMFIHDEIIRKQHVFKIKGPLGLGLNISKNGKHIAFAAGTGILVFIDLIAHLILRLIQDSAKENIFLNKANSPQFNYIDI